MKFWNRTTRRMLFVFGLLFLVMSAASFSAFKALSDIHDVLNRVVLDNRELRTTLALATAIRDQYAHEAHTIILGNTTHLGYHEKACARVAELSARMSSQWGDTEEGGRIQAIEEVARTQARIFLDEVVPAVLVGDEAAVQAEHAKLLAMVDTIQQELDAIAATLGDRVRSAEQEADRIARSALLWLFLSHGLALAFAVGAALYLRRSIAYPLAVLGRGARRLARGDLETVIELDTKDEFAALAGQFNTMTRALARHQAQLVQQEKLAAVGRLAAGVAHEINNPLGVILGYARLMKERADGQLLDDLVVIEEEAVRTQHIVEGLLDLARPIAVSNDPVDLGSMCREVGERVAGSLPHPAPRLTVSGEGTVTGNEHALRQVLGNLLKNAMEAAGPDGTVQVRIEQATEEEVCLCVEDSGPGLSEEMASRLFEPFFTTKARGTGLGLAVSRVILEAHGGRIEAANRAEGGARFMVTLPVGRNGKGRAGGVHP